MPTAKVNGKTVHYPYTAAGKAAAAKANAAPASKPAAAGSKSAPSPKANPIAAARSHGQQGAAMKAAHAQPKAKPMPLPTFRVLGSGTSAPSTVTGTSGKKVVVRPAAGKTAKRR